MRLRLARLRHLWFLFLLLAMAAAWGLQFAMIKLAAESGYHEINLLTLALLLIALAYLAILCARGELFRLTRAGFWFFAITALIGYLIPLVAVVYAAAHLPAGILSTIASLTPVVTVSVALALRTEPVSALRLAAMVLGCVAIGLVLLPETELPGYGSLRWLLLVSLVPLCYGVESIYVAAYWPDRLNAFQVGLGEALAATLMLIPIFVLLGDWDMVLPTQAPALIGVGVFVLTGVVEVVLYFYLIQHTGGVLVSFGTFISLFAGIGWGMVIFAERHGAMVWLAVAFLVGSLALLCWETLKAAPRARPHEAAR